MALLHVQRKPRLSALDSYTWDEYISGVALLHVQYKTQQNAIGAYTRDEYTLDEVVALSHVWRKTRLNAIGAYTRDDYIFGEVLALLRAQNKTRLNAIGAYTRDEYILGEFLAFAALLHAFDKETPYALCSYIPDENRLAFGDEAEDLLHVQYKTQQNAIGTYTRDKYKVLAFAALLHAFDKEIPYALCSYIPDENRLAFGDEAEDLLHVQHKVFFPLGLGSYILPASRFYGLSLASPSF